MIRTIYSKKYGYSLPFCKLDREIITIFISLWTIWNGWFRSGSGGRHLFKLDLELFPLIKIKLQLEAAWVTEPCPAGPGWCTKLLSSSLLFSSLTALYAIIVWYVFFSPQFCGFSWERPRLQSGVLSACGCWPILTCPVFYLLLLFSFLSRLLSPSWSKQMASLPEPGCAAGFFS